MWGRVSLTSAWLGLRVQCELRHCQARLGRCRGRRSVPRATHIRSPRLVVVKNIVQRFPIQCQRSRAGFSQRPLRGDARRTMAAPSRSPTWQHPHVDVLKEWEVHKGHDKYCERKGSVSRLLVRALPLRCSAAAVAVFRTAHHRWRLAGPLHWQAGVAHPRKRVHRCTHFRAKVRVQHTARPRPPVHTGTPLQTCAGSLEARRTSLACA